MDFLDLKTVKKTRIYTELQEQGLADKWFYFKGKKVVSHIDTFYYSVKVAGLWDENLGARQLVAELRELKEEAERGREGKPFFEEDVLCNDLEVLPFFGFKMYRFGISRPDCFDIFVAESVPDCNTSPIVVQLRSQFLWLRGTEAAFYDSLVYLLTILDHYGIKVADITENRLDFAYHTNYIQDMLHFFADENLGEMQVSSFRRWGKEGCFNGSGIEADYITLGRRSSNNCFVRIYNKSKEVIERGYKQFFVPLWLAEGLISEFDKYVFDVCFEEGKQVWNFKDVARCRFYLEHGHDPDILEAIRGLMDSANASAEDFRRLADFCVPDLTNITNIEIQTKRKFYTNFRFPPIQYPDWLPFEEKRIYLILHMLQSIRDFITYNTIRFVDFRGRWASERRERRPTADWWLRLSACGELDGVNYDLCKDYQRRFDWYRGKARSISSLAMLASLADQRDGPHLTYSLEDDWADFLSYFNDNDLERYQAMRERKHREVMASHF